VLFTRFVTLSRGILTIFTRHLGYAEVSTYVLTFCSHSDRLLVSALRHGDDSEKAILTGLIHIHNTTVIL